MFIVIVSLDVVHAQGISVSCPDSVRPGKSFNCTIKGDYSGYYGAVEAVPKFSTGLSLGSFSVGSSFNSGGFTTTKLSVIADSDITGSSNVGTFTVTMLQGVTTSQSITFTDVKIIDSEFNNIVCSDVVVNIKVDTSVESSSNSNKSSNKYSGSSNGNSQAKEVSTKISSIKLSTGSIDFNSDVNDYQLEVDNEVTDINIDIELVDSNSKVSVTGNNDLQVGDNEVVIVVTGSDGSTNTYSIFVKRLDKSDNSLLDSLKIKGYEIDFDSEKFEYYIKLKEEDKSLDIEAIPVSDKARVVIGGNKELENGKIVTIIVEAEDSSTSMYVLRIIEVNSLRMIYGLGGAVVVTIIIMVVVMIIRKKKNH
jgi:hypothetical protein